ncbi:MAG: hypothetical protein KDH96_09755, partial [Candidatus Riesia sp.]|nr:hypothetical protein [Candidatus Riesia sp.]
MEVLRPYTTSDTPFAAFLVYSGMKVVATKQDPNDYKREIILFIDIPEIHDLEKTWRLGEAEGD